MNLNKLVVIVAVAAVAVSAMAQGGGGGGRGQGRGQRGAGGNQFSVTALLRRTDVQKDLAITDDQKTKITEIGAAVRTKMQDLSQNGTPDRAAMTKINEDAAKDTLAVLTADQQTRLKGIMIQLAKGRAATLKEIQGDLGLSDDQKTKIDDLVKRQTAANTEIQGKVRDGSLDQAGATAERTKNEQILSDEVDKVLTDAQKAKLKDMAGKPFAAEPQQQGRRGGGGRAGGGI